MTLTKKRSVQAPIVTIPEAIQELRARGWNPEDGPIGEAATMEPLEGLVDALNEGIMRATNSASCDDDTWHTAASALWDAVFKCCKIYGKSR